MYRYVHVYVYVYVWLLCIHAISTYDYFYD